MKHYLWYIAIFSLSVLFFYSCAQNKSESSSYEDSMMMSIPADEAVDEVSSRQTVVTANLATESKNTKDVYTSSAAALDVTFGNREFIRTSEMKFKVDNVIKATYQLEDIAMKFGGFVEKSSIRSIDGSTSEINISADSAKLITYYQLESFIKIRVPVQQLDSTLKAIAPIVGKMDYRVVTANDVSLSLLSEKLKQDREKKFNSNVGNIINSQRNKLDDVVDAESARKIAQERADAAYISSLSIKDQIEYSTLSINLYQQTSVKKEIIARTFVEEEYAIPFTERLKDAFSFGWNIVVSIFLCLIYIWPFLLIAVAGWLAYRYFKKKS